MGGLAVDAAGSIYVADWYNNRVRKITRAGIITTIVGGGEDFYWPQGVALDSSGNLYVTAGGLHTLRSDGSFLTLIGWSCGEPSGAPGLCAPEQIAIDGAGNLYIPEECRIRKLTPDGVMVTVAGMWWCGYSGDGGPAVAARLGLIPFAVAVDSTGNLYIADTYNNCIRKVDAAGIITTVAGRCGSWGGYGGDGGYADHARLRLPSGVAVDGAGNLYIADTYNRRVRKVTSDGIITTVAGNGGMLSP